MKHWSERLGKFFVLKYTSGSSHNRKNLPKVLSIYRAPLWHDDSNNPNWLIGGQHSTLGNGLRLSS
jgi:hypothetical protein